MAARHSINERYADRLAAIIHQRDLEAAAPTCADLRLLPVWVWAVPGIRTGRKGSQNGAALELPIRVSWDTGTVVAGGTHAAWRAEGMGWAEQGTVRVDADQVDLGAFGLQPAPLLHGLGARAEVVQSGHLAWWEMLGDLERMARRYVSRAHAGLRSELSAISGWETPPLLGTTDEEVVVDRIILGAGVRESRATRLLLRCLKPTTFRAVDPVRYVSRALRRDAEDELHKQVGEPYGGRKVRALAAELGVSEPSALLEAYTRTYPLDHMGLDRIQSALALSTTCASWISPKGV